MLSENLDGRRSPRSPRLPGQCAPPGDPLRQGPSQVMGWLAGWLAYPRPALSLVGYGTRRNSRRTRRTADDMRLPLSNFSLVVSSSPQLHNWIVVYINYMHTAYTLQSYSMMAATVDCRWQTADCSTAARKSQPRPDLCPFHQGSLLVTLLYAPSLPALPLLQRASERQ